MKLAETLIDLQLDGKISGALYDFMGFLTTRPEVVTTSAYHETHDLLDAFKEWLNARDMVTHDSPDINGWHVEYPTQLAGPDTGPQDYSMEATSKSGISVLHVGKIGSDWNFEVVWPNGTRENYLINPNLGRKYLARLGHGAVGAVANDLKDYGRKL